MNKQRRGYVIALVLAVMALLVSVGAALAVVTRGGSSNNSWSPVASQQDGWRQGLGAGMMGPGSGGAGMMGGWDERGTATITPEQARSKVEAWVAANQPGAKVGGVVQMPMGYVFSVTKGGQTVGTVMVNDDTGALGWWGYAQPTPTPSSS